MTVFYCVGKTLTLPVVGYVDVNSIAAQAGIQSGDRIQSMNGKKIDNFESLQEGIAKSAHQKIFLQMTRGEKNLDLTLIPESKDSIDLLGDLKIMGDIGIHPHLESIVGRVVPGKPAFKAGLQPGDKIIQIENTPIKFWEEMLARIHNNPNKPLKIVWQRKNTEKNQEAILTPEPQIVSSNTPGTPKKTIGLIGITPQGDEKMGFQKNISPLEAMTLSVEKIGADTWLTLRAIKKLILGQISKDNLMGPVRLAGLVTDVAQSGFFPWLLFLGIISLQLAIFNFLPIPALDGGHAVFFLWELLTGKMVNLKLQDRLTRVGFSMLILLFVFVVINDVTTLFK
jgi:regulator of sigma E protease